MARKVIDCRVMPSESHCSLTITGVSSPVGGTVSTTSYTVQPPSSFTGAVYSGLVVGVTAGAKVIKPLSETWPSANGSFSMTLPASARGRTLTFWQNQRQAFSHFAARPGGPIDLSSWPAQLGDAVPTGLAALKIHR